MSNLPELILIYPNRNPTLNPVLMSSEEVTAGNISVNGFAATSPPSPVEGEAYLLSGTGGDFSEGQVNDIAIWDGDSWLFSTPEAGWVVWNSATNELLVFDGVDWTPLGGGASVGSWQDPVLDFTSTPPGGPTTGDRILVKPTGTGAFAGQDNNIAVWNGTSWDFTTPEEGWAVWDVTSNLYYSFNGTAWVNFGAATSNYEFKFGLPSGGPGDLYMNLTGSPGSGSTYPIIRPLKITGYAVYQSNASSVANDIEIYNNGSLVLTISMGAGQTVKLEPGITPVNLAATTTTGLRALIKGIGATGARLTDTSLILYAVSQ